VAHAVIGLSLLMLTGWAGEVSLGQLAVAGTAAAAVAFLHVPGLLALPVAAAAGAAVAVAVGLPALRLRGLDLAVTTLAFAVAVDAVVLGPRGLGDHLPRAVDAPAVAGLHLSDGRTLFFASVAVLLAVALVIASLRRSRTARALIAARDNEAAAAAFGIDITRARLGAFAVSGAMAGLGGALIMWQDHGVRALSFSAEQGLRLFVFAVVGGLGSLAGPLLGFAYEAAAGILSVSPAATALASGLGGLALLLVAPGGLAQLARAGVDAALRRIARRQRLVVPELTGIDGGSERAAIAGTRAPVPLPSRYDLPGQWAVTGHG
jgi:branched-chain amino acid transport system permease protein